MRRRLLARHPELAHHSDLLGSSGAWARWQVADARLDPFVSLDDLARTWLVDRSRPCYAAVAALAGVGSRRGLDDDEAALAVVVALHRDLDLLADQLKRVCEPDDVVWAVWDAVKRAEPHLGCRAPYFLLHRAKERLVDAHHRAVLEPPMSPVLDRDREHRMVVSGQVSAVPGDGGSRDTIDQLSELLRWAASAGVIATAEARLLNDLVLGSRSRDGIEDAMRLAGQRHGVGMRTVRRRRDAAVQRLRTALPAYLAAVS